MTKPAILTFETYDDRDTEPLEAAYEVFNLPYGAKVSELPSNAVARIEAFAFRGHGTLGAEIMDVFPKLGMIANYGVGYDTIDVDYAASKGIKVTNTPDVLTDDVAGPAVGMVIAQSRGMVGASDWILSGNWVKSGAFPLQRKVSGKNIGIVGLGRIGRAVAERLQQSRFRSEKPDRYRDSKFSKRGVQLSATLPALKPHAEYSVEVSVRAASADETCSLAPAHRA